MGCCENKSLQSEFLMFPDRNVEVQEQNFDDISIYTEGDETRKYSNSSPRPLSGINTINSVEMAFLLGSINKSKSIILADYEIL